MDDLVSAIRDWATRRLGIELGAGPIPDCSTTPNSSRLSQKKFRATDTQYPHALGDASLPQTPSQRSGPVESYGPSFV